MLGFGVEVGCWMRSVSFGLEDPNKRLKTGERDQWDTRARAQVLLIKETPPQSPIQKRVQGVFHFGYVKKKKKKTVLRFLVLLLLCTYGNRYSIFL